MLKEEEEEDFTLLERMHLSLNRFRAFMRHTQSIVIISIAVAGGMAALFGYDYHDAFNRYGHVETLENPCPPFNEQSCTLFVPSSDDLESLYELIGFSYETINEMIAGLIIISCAQAVLGFRLLAGRKIRKELKELQSQFIRQSYLLNFETSIPKGKTSVQKIFNLATIVFPELKKEKIKAKAEGERLSSSAKKLKKKDYTYDLVLDTNEGNFIVKSFQDMVKFEDIEELVDSIKTNFDDGKDVFRVISLAKKYDKIFETDELIDKMEHLKRKFNLDLIIEEEKGFSMIWID